MRSNLDSSSSIVTRHLNNISTTTKLSIMKKGIPAIFLLFVLILSACGPGENTVEASMDTTVKESADVSAKGFETVVINDSLPSPRKLMKATVGNTNINVNYGSPSVKGRAVWSGLVPYDKVWRTGANEATTIEFSTDVMIEGKKLPAGKYGLFAIPNQKEWVIIFNSVADQWGAFDYDSAKDVLRVNVVPVEQADNQEALIYEMDGDKLVLKWEKLAVPISIKN